MRILQLNHASLEVIDVAKTTRFYEEVVGLVQIPRPAFGFPGTWFRVGVDQELHLIGGAGQRVSSSSRGDHFAIGVDSIEAAIERLNAHHIPFKGPHHRPDGAKQVFFEDPDGHVVEFCTLAPRG